MLLSAHWVETGAGVGWASFNSDGQDISTASKVIIVGLAGLVVAGLGAALGALVGLMIGGLRPRPGMDPTRRLGARLAATWVVACMPLLHVAIDGTGSYTGEVPRWSLLAGGACSLVWLSTHILRRSDNHP